MGEDLCGGPAPPHCLAAAPGTHIDHQQLSQDLGCVWMMTAPHGRPASLSSLQYRPRFLKYPPSGQQKDSPWPHAVPRMTPCSDRDNASDIVGNTHKIITRLSEGGGQDLVPLLDFKIYIHKVEMHSGLFCTSTRERHRHQHECVTKAPEPGQEGTHSRAPSAAGVQAPWVQRRGSWGGEEHPAGPSCRWALDIGFITLYVPLRRSFYVF